MQPLLSGEMSDLMALILKHADEPIEMLDLDEPIEMLDLDEPIEMLDLDEPVKELDLDACPPSRVPVKVNPGLRTYGRNAVKISIRIHPHSLKKIRERAEAAGLGYQQLMNAMLRDAVAAWSAPKP